MIAYAKCDGNLFALLIKKNKLSRISKNVNEKSVKEITLQF